MLNRVLKCFLVMAALVALAAVSLHAQPKWKDQAEYDLVASFTKEPDPNKKIAILDSWKEKYPNTEFKNERMQYYLATYAAAQKWQQVWDTAKAILTENPKDVQSLYWLTSLAPTISGTAAPSADVLDTAEKAANGLLNAEKPAATPEDAWKKAKGDLDNLAHRSLGWIQMTRKNNEGAEQEFTKLLTSSPNDGTVSSWLGTVILGQKKPERQVEALWHFARAASYDGPGAMPPAARQQMDAYLTKVYTAYHGQDDAGLRAFKAQAKAQVFPPAGFKIESKQEIEVAKENKFASENPQLALWMNVKKQLADANGEQYFEGSMKGAEIPKLRGKLISHKPAVRPTTLVIGIENPDKPEVTIKLDAALPGKADPGTDIEFDKGVPIAFTKEPFMVTFDVEKANVHGWPAQAAPTPVRRPAGKKAAKK